MRQLREGLFIKKNKDRWEQVQQGTTTDADETARQFIELTDDLAYAKTFYPNSRTTQYINSLAAKIYLGIYENRREDSSRLLTFWKYDVPQVIYRYRRTILFCLFVFLLFFAVGFFSSLHDETFVREALGEDYVAMTEKNIEEGNPFGVYRSGNSFFMWLGIMINNIMVSLFYFVKGILFGILSLTELIKEAIRLGAFEHMFYAKGLGTQAVITILIHGMLELTAIIIACAAGVIMGKSILFPGTLTRLDALRTGVKDGLKIIIGLMPIFMLAAFFEGFVTRHYQMPLALSLLLLLISGTFVAGYFVIYPVWLHRKMQKHIPADA